MGSNPVGGIKRFVAKAADLFLLSLEISTTISPSKRSFTIFVNGRSPHRLSKRMNTTKEKILSVALKLFSQNGFAAVSTSDIASELSLTKGALYKHFKNKRDIFRAILKKMEEDDAQSASLFSMPEKSIQADPEAYDKASVKAFFDFTRNRFAYWTGNDFAVKFRRMLVHERFADKTSGKQFQQYLCAGPFGYTRDIFQSLGFKHPDKLALDFFAPIFFLYSLSDHSKQKDKIQELFDLHLQEMEKKINGQMHYPK